MALGTCRDCGQPVSFDARVCPKCGADEPAETAAHMRRVGWVKFVVAVIVLVLLIIWLSIWLSP